MIHQASWHTYITLSQGIVTTNKYEDFGKTSRFLFDGKKIWGTVQQPGQCYCCTLIDHKPNCPSSCFDTIKESWRTRKWNVEMGRMPSKRPWRELTV